MSKQTAGMYKPELAAADDIAISCDCDACKAERDGATAADETVTVESILTDDIRKSLPALYSQENLGEAAIVHARLISPVLGWSWLLTECDGEDLAFGLVIGFEAELGYVSLAELAESSARVRVDRYWQPMTLAEARLWMEGATV